MSDSSMTTSSKMKDAILKRLEAEGITPRSRIYFLAHEYALWGAWGATVLLGAVSLAVLSFSSVYMGYALYEATHVNLLTFLIDALPVLWFGAVLLMVVAAYFNMRHTKKGYKYPVILVIGSSLGFSVLGGVVLHYLGAGFYFDRFLGEVSNAYESRMEFEAHLWQAPKQGRLVGHAELPDETGAIKGLLFTDIEDESWQLIPEGLSKREAEMLRSGRKVKIIVATTSETRAEVFIACGVFPWMMDEVPVIAKWREDRHKFLERVEERRERVREIMKEAQGDEQVVKVSDEKMPTSSTLALEEVPVDSEHCGLLPLFRAKNNE